MPTAINYEQRVTFGQELKRLREEAGLTVEQLSDASGFKVGTIINVEAGKFSIKMDVANSLLGVLGYEVGAVKLK